jgi:GNAT superfamily N-acetyltransferase
MGPVYTAAKLPAEKVDQAFPLMRTVEPGLELAQWRDRYAAMAAGDAAGGEVVLVVSGPAGRYHALCVAEARRPPDREAAVAVSKLFIDGVLDAHGIARAMLDALAAYCRANGCVRLQIEMRGTDEVGIGAVAAAGAVLRGRAITVELI